MVRCNSKNWVHCRRSSRTETNSVVTAEETSKAGKVCTFDMNTLGVARIEILIMAADVANAGSIHILAGPVLYCYVIYFSNIIIRCS